MNLFQILELTEDEKLAIEALGLLSPGQRQVFWQSALAKTSKEISQAVGCSKASVDMHIREIHARTGLKDKRQLIRIGCLYDRVPEFLQDRKVDRGFASRLQTLTPANLQTICQVALGYEYGQIAKNLRRREAQVRGAIRRANTHLGVNNRYMLTRKLLLCALAMRDQSEAA